MRGRAMLRPLFGAQAAAWASAPLLWLPLPHWTWTVLNDAGGTVFFTSSAGFIVVLMWNLLHPDREPRLISRQHVRLRPEEEFRANLARASRTVTRPRTGRWENAVREAQRAGTFSLNGVRQRGTTLRYPGPPAIYTPPAGYRLPHDGPVCGGCGQAITPVLRGTRAFFFCPDCTEVPEALRAPGFYGQGS